MINNYSCINIYENRKKNSKLSSQILYGEKFTIIKKYKDCYKIKTNYDKYVGFIKKRKFRKSIHKPTHKVSSLKANVFSKPDNNSRIRMKLSFASLLQVKSKNKDFFNFESYWIKKSDVVPINYKEEIFSRIKIFKNVKYKWGGKKFDGIDCSGLVQIFFKFNNLYCPRDTGPQFKYFKKLKSIKKNAIIFWKGHVAICLSKRRLIHAYGPKKKVIIMDIKKTINLIKKTARLEVIGIK
ncbi:NlpC/P60 family protein [Candidatus Pelagibacter communis]|uniref:NlpC/P60 family protein n=1 Tax=Pelagibacter ubique TaxID=198252 RepID=UPI00094BFEFB|nr:NlpC/P60 family protein [Candidatus Pelagibacter ubique]